VNTHLPSSWLGANESLWLGVAHTGERPLRVPPGELAVVDLGSQ
jgi:hypothetical protein